MTMRLTWHRTLRMFAQVACCCGAVAFAQLANPTAVAEESATRIIDQRTGQPLDLSRPEFIRGGDSILSDGAVLYESPDGTLYPPGSSDVLPADCGYSCPPDWIFSFDAVYLYREEDRGNSLSRFITFDEFGYDLAGRITVARRYDCLVGWEAVYLGPFEWNQTGAAAGAGLNSLLGADGINLSAFNTNAVAQQQTYTSFLQSTELSQKWWGWDVIATSAGMRYINVEEDLFYNSVNAAAESGSLTVLTNNHLVGGQVGLDLFFPVGRFSTTTKVRGSIYANFMDSSTLVTNAGAVQVNNSAEEVDFASLIEVGYYFSYFITPRVSVKAGYEVMWMYGLALAPNQLSNPVNLNTGFETDRDGDVFFHGGTVGVEVTW